MLVDRSSIIDQLKAMEAGNDPSEVAGDFGSKDIYKLLGYFSLIGLTRVHCLLGDFFLALKQLDYINLYNKGGLFTLVPACQFTLFYYAGFAYLMMRRYSDAINIWTYMLIWQQRTQSDKVKTGGY